MSNGIADLQQQLQQFAADRDWERYHTPRNLAALIASEAGELLALFRWDEAAIEDRPEDVCCEVADVFLGLLRFADVTGIDLVQSGREKIEINARNYPVSMTSGPERG